MPENKQPEGKENELIINHFILAIIVLFESLIKLLNIVIPMPRDEKSNTTQTSNQIKSGGGEDIFKEMDFLSQKNKDELKKLLNNVDVLSSLNKNQLTNLILSNQNALELVKTQREREILEKMTNQEIRSLLKGVEGISRYKKAQLVDMVLRREKKTIENI